MPILEDWLRDKKYPGYKMPDHNLAIGMAHASKKSVNSRRTLINGLNVLWENSFCKGEHVKKRLAGRQRAT
jgi:hypothetical protein